MGYILRFWRDMSLGDSVQPRAAVMGAALVSLGGLRGGGRRPREGMWAVTQGALRLAEESQGLCGMELCPFRAQAKATTAERAEDISAETGRTSLTTCQGPGYKATQPPKDEGRCNPLPWLTGCQAEAENRPCLPPRNPHPPQAQTRSV